MSLSNIKVKHLPSIFPNIDFEPDINANSYRWRSDVELISSIVNLPRAFATVEKPLVSERYAVQTVIYESGVLDFKVDENQKITISQFAETVEIITDEGETIDARIVDAPISEIDGSQLFNVSLEVKRLVPDFQAVNNFLERQFIVAKVGEANLNKLTINTNPDWTNAKALGSVQFPSGYDFATTPHKFRLDVGDGYQTVIVSTTCATQADIVDAINNEIISVLYTYGKDGDFRAFDGGTYIGFTSQTNDANTFFDIATVPTQADQLLDLLGVDGGRYDNTVALDSAFNAIGNTFTFLTRLMPEFATIKESENSETLDGIELPVYSNTFATLTMKFYLDDTEPVIGQFTEAQAFAYYVPNTFYIDDTGQPSGVAAEIQVNGSPVNYTALSQVEISEEPNENLIGLKEFDITIKYANIQNYRLR